MLTSLCGHTQTVPDAGMLRQQIEQGNKNFNPVPKIPEKITPAPLQKLTGQTLIVKAFKFSGNTLLSNEVLQVVVKHYLNRSLDFAQLQDAAAAVGKAYRAAGWIVRVYLPQQEIEDGMVTIEVVEALFGGARFEGQPAVRLSNTRILKYVAAAQKTGEPLYAPAIDRVLLLLGDIPGIAVSGNLGEGKAAGQTDLVFNVQDKPLFAADGAVDNTGSRSTGSERISGNLYLNSPLGWGDQLSSNSSFSEGSGYVRLAYSLPFGQNGWRTGASTSTMHYRVITPELKALNSLGSSSTFGLDASYPVLRSTLKNLYFVLNYDYKNFNNEANRNITTHYFINTFSAGLNSNLVDNYLGGGMNNAGLGWLHGTADLKGSPNQFADAATIKTNGQFNKVRYSVSRLQALSESLTAYIALSGQVADKNLDSAEKFYLGGANGVRAYPSSEGGGSDGQMLNMELKTRLPFLPSRVDLTGFYDWGHVTVNHNNNFIGAGTLNSFNLKGAGVAVGWTGNAGLNLKLSWARRIGNNPNPTAAGKDQDGSLNQNRFWLYSSIQL